MSRISIKQLLKEAEANTKSGAKNYYKPFGPKESKALRKYFASKIEIPLEGDDWMEFYNAEGTPVAKGYNRVVIGDYGAYVEFRPEQILHARIKQKWEGSEKKAIKYIWMETIDEEKTKIYFQRKTVPYADYKVGMYYIHPSSLVIREWEGER